MQSFFKNTIKQSRWYNVSQCKTMRWMNTTTTTTNRNLLKAYRVLNVTSDATQDQIKLTDNGHGISQLDLPFAPIRHATSKIN